MAERKPQVTKPDVADGQTWKSEFERYQKLQALRKETSLWKPEVDITVKTGDFPYFLLHPLSDLHMGAIGVDTPAVEKHLALIKDFPVYTALLGDLGDFFSPTKHPEGMMGDVFAPDEQMALLRKFMQEYQERILCSVQDPSHTDWIRQSSGIEPQRWMTQDLGIPLLQSGGKMRIKVNDIDYSLLLFHKIARFNSSLNITNAGKRMLDMCDDADAVVSGHTHIGALEKVVKRGHKPYVINLGTFKTDDGFGTRNGMVPSPQVFFPTLLLDGRRKNIEVIEDVDSAREFISCMGNFLKKKGVAMLGLSKK